MYKCNCGLKPDHYYQKKHLCKYHYWIARGRSVLEKWFFIWKEYQYLHPVRVARWKEQDVVLKELLEGDKK